MYQWTSDARHQNRVSSFSLSVLFSCHSSSHPDSLCVFDCLFGFSSIAKRCRRTLSVLRWIRFVFSVSLRFSSHDGHCSRLSTGPTRIHAYTCTYVYLSTCRHSLTSKAAHPITSHSLTITYTFVLCRTTRNQAIPGTMLRTQTRIVSVHESITAMS